jgi:lipopolysaccharide biosynthesis glycosyltransferase/LPS sulfotransferase NodH
MSLLRDSKMEQPSYPPRYPRVQFGSKQQSRVLPSKRYNIMVPLQLEPEERSPSKSVSLVSLWQQLPTLFRLIFGVYLLNLLYLISFSTHHFNAVESGRHLVVTNYYYPKNVTVLNSRNEYANHDAVLVVIISDRLDGIIPTVASILTHTKSKPVDLVLIGNNAKVNEGVREHFMDRNRTTGAKREGIRQFTSLSIKDVQADLIRQGYSPIWTWPEWGSSRKSDWFKPDQTLHVADWDRLETHAHELNHLRFYLPLVSQFLHHEYLYFLDDDILVQKDLGFIADATMKTLDKSKGLVTPCNIWIWNSECHHFSFENEDTIKTILKAPSLYGDRSVCQSDSESHCYPASYTSFLESVLPIDEDLGNSSNLKADARNQKAWNFGFSLFALDHWRQLNLTARYEDVMKESYRLHIFPETSLTFGLGVSYIAFAGAVECWNDEIMKVRDGFGFIEWNRFSQTFGQDFLNNSVDVIHYTGPTKPWIANTTIEPRSLQPWLDFMESEGMKVPDQLPTENGKKLFTLLGSDRSGAQWIMSILDNHPSICASGEGQKPESGFPADVMLPMGLPWFPICSVKRGCSFAFMRDAVLELSQGMDKRGRTGRIPTQCRWDYIDVDKDGLGHHLPRVCRFLRSLQGNFTDAAIAAKWVDSFRDEDQDFVGCSCPRGTTIKGLKVFSEWLVHKKYPHLQTGPLAINLDDSAIRGSKIIRLKRRNIWARYLSSTMAQKSGIYHIKSPGEKENQLTTAGSVTISIEDMLWKLFNMQDLDRAGDDWARQHGSDVLVVYHEDCRDNTTSCFRKIFEFLGVDAAFLEAKPRLFAPSFASTSNDADLSQIKNRGAVEEALSVHGMGRFIGISNFTEVQLLIYDESETMDKAHQYHPEKGINSLMFGRKNGANMTHTSKFRAAVPILQSMPSDAMVVLSDSRDVRIQFPAGNDFLRYEAIYNFRTALKDLTHGFPGAVVASTESHCCSSALTHSKPGHFFQENGQRRHRSCLSGSPGCEWAGDSNALTWQSMMKDLAKRYGYGEYEHIYLDATLIGGKAEDLLSFIEATDIDEGEDDRAVFTDFMLQNPGKLILDYEQRIFGKNREGLRSSINSGCPFTPSHAEVARSLQSSDVSHSIPLFMHAPRELGCNPIERIVSAPAFPRWGESGIQIGPILGHIDRVVQETATLTVTGTLGKPIYYQGPEIPYFPDENGVWTSKLIRERTDNLTLVWRMEPTEGLIVKAHQIIKSHRGTNLRWSALRKTLRTGGFPFWAWYGDFKACNFRNSNNDSIPLFTTCALAECDHAFPIPNYMNIIDSQPSSDNWRGLFRDTSKEFPWQSKIRKVVWRGSLSEADGAMALNSVRWRAARLVHRLNSSLFDVGFTSIPTWVTNQVTVNISAVGGLVPGIAPMSNFQNYMAILDMDGNSWSSRFASLLCYNSVVIKVEPKYIEYFYSSLQPWTHYIPIKDDLSDLLENVQWALSPDNEETVQDIITSANEWCTQRMVPDELAHDLLDVWESYVRHLDHANSNWQELWIQKKSEIFSATSKLHLSQI